MAHNLSTITPSWLQKARRAITYKDRFTDVRGLDTKKNYSSYWMGDDVRSSAVGYSGDKAKLIKLTNYRRAITNFVKLVCKKDIPVLWHAGSSCTNSSVIYLTTDIKEKNFDVVVGLALHEAAHIVLTDFELCKYAIMMTEEAFVLDQQHHKNMPVEIGYYNQICQFQRRIAKIKLMAMISYDDIFGLVNWIEDRRIDHYIFSNSPGYKAYYHKMYDHYWNDKIIHRGLISSDYCDPQELQHWMFRIINSINGSADPNAIIDLDKVMAIIDLPNIDRLKSTADTVSCALDVLDVITPHLMTVPSYTELQNQADKRAACKKNLPDGLIAQETDPGAGMPCTQEEKEAIDKLVNRKQKEFLSAKGVQDKKRCTRTLEKDLETTNLEKVDLYVSQYTGSRSKINVLTYDCTSTAAVSALMQDSIVYTASNKKLDEMNNLNGMSSPTPTEAAAKALLNETMRILYRKMESLQDVMGLRGLCRQEIQDHVIAKIDHAINVGQLLGRKLKTRAEVRSRIDNRQLRGRIDARRLAHAGYGIDTIFSQAKIDTHKKVNVHISLDISGSMRGEKWEACLATTMAIAVAAIRARNIDVQVSVRGTCGDNATLYNIYDSRINAISHLKNIFALIEPNRLTPEGLCYEAMLAAHALMPGSAILDSYLINISDGMPGMSGYDGSEARLHTAAQIKKIKALNIGVISYYVQEGCISPASTSFKNMYGNTAESIDAHSAISIATSLNKRFMMVPNV